MCTYLEFCGVHSLLVGIRLTRLLCLGVWIHSKYNLFSFLSGFAARQYFGIWVSSVSQITSPPGNELAATNLSSVVWKFTTCWFFGGLYLSAKFGREVCISADTYMANRECGPRMPISPCNDWEGGRERQSRPLPLSCHSYLQLSSADGQMY